MTVCYRIIVVFGGWLLLLGTCRACSTGQCQLSESCSASSDCATGLYCSSCAVAGTGLRCIRSSTYNVLLLNKDLPFNRYAWLTTHNSYAIAGEPSHTGVPRETFDNQEDTITDQLNEPVLNTLKEIEAFLAAHPSEIVTIFIEDYVHANKGLSKAFTVAGLMEYWFPVSEMPKNGGDWPRVSDMIAKNQRLVVFTSNSSKEAMEGIAYQWKYVVENQYGDGGMKAGSCPNRAESLPLSTTSRSLVLENFFPDDPTQTGACQDNSDMLMSMLNVCHAAAAQRWANFLAVDFYKRSERGGAFQAVDMLNGRLMCGCVDVRACKPGAATSGLCTP